MTATAPAPTSAPASHSPSSTERQLELTLNAIARSFRKALRLAERDDPTGTTGLWKAVEHRSALLMQMLEAAAQYARRYSPVASVAAPAPAASRELASVEEQVPVASSPAANTKPKVAATVVDDFAGTPLQALPGMGTPEAAENLDPRFRLLQLLTARATTLGG